MAGDMAGDMAVELEQAWHDHRRHVLDVCVRMLGNLPEAEDVVQETYARLVRADVDEIDEVGGWLVVVASRLCLDRLRADRRHPTAPDDAVGDRTIDRGGDPADRVTLDDNVGLALHLVLERLTAAERTAFILHDVFQYPFEAIGEIVGRSPTACRQLASRARRTVREEAGPSRFVVETAEERQVVERFIAACSSGDLDGLVAVLAPDATGDSDVAIRPFHGNQRMARGALFFLGPESSTTLLSFPAGGQPGVVALRDDEVVAFATFTIEDGRITKIHALADPANLGPIRAALGS